MDEPQHPSASATPPKRQDKTRARRNSVGRFLDQAPAPISLAVLLLVGQSLFRVLCSAFPAIQPDPRIGEILLDAQAWLVLLAFVVGVPIWLHREKLKRYTSGEFYGIWWGWEYDWRGEPVNPEARCRACKEPIEYPEETWNRLWEMRDNHVCKICWHDTRSRTREKIPVDPKAAVLDQIKKGNPNQARDATE